jgi:hypothetical protein
MMRRRFALVLLVVAPALTPMALAQSANPNRAPNTPEQFAALAAIREYALGYTQRLPDYACTQVTHWATTYTFPHAQGPTGGVTEAQTPGGTGVTEAQIGYLDHREMEKVTTINGKPAARAEAKDLPPASSHGEFGSLLALIFDPQTPTEFHWRGRATRNGRRMYVFSYHVPKPAGYVLQEGQRTTVVPAEGLVYADFETKAVTRIEMQCTDIPSDSGYRSLELTLNYKLTSVAGREFMLPSDFKLNSRQRQAADNIFGFGIVDTEVKAQFKDYRRFSADSEIQFER